MSIEDNLARKIDSQRSRREELSPFMQKAYERAQGILSDPDFTIQESDFTEEYGDERVKGDIALGLRLEQKFLSRQTPEDANTKKIADTFEAIMLMESEMSEWFGKARTMKASRFDDYINKIDMVAEWSKPNEGSSVMALGVDVTFGTTGVEKKMTEIRNQIEQGTLAQIRYFKDEQGNFKGTRHNVPRLVIGVSQGVVTELAGLWMNGEKKALGAHPVQGLLLAQIESQLRQQHAYAVKFQKFKIVNAHKEAIIRISEVRKSKEGIDYGALREDPVAKSIFEEAKRQFAA